jgi:peptidoglycan hydrolase CwlO-like protein
MKKTILNLAFAVIVSASLFACKEETKLGTLEDNLENRSDDLEDASDEVADAADDIEDALGNFQDALREVENAEDRAALRQRVNKIFDDMDVEMNKE